MTDDDSKAPRERKVATYFISNMDCVNEEKIIREGLATLPGIDQLDFDLAKRRLKITHTLENDELLVASLKELGMRPARVGPAG